MNALLQKVMKELNEYRMKDKLILDQEQLVERKEVKTPIGNFGEFDVSDVYPL